MRIEPVRAEERRLRAGEKVIREGIGDGMFSVVESGEVAEPP
ncbi:MAG: hypothetical protein U0R69_10690 [Gaiellales bacterium]